MTTKAEKAHMNRVAEIGCIACRKVGFYGTPAELHHIRETAGMGQRSDADEVIPLCPAHHRGIMHPAVPSIHLARKAFMRQFGKEADLVGEVNEILNPRGMAA
jgi:hypothetical protein